MNSKQRFRARFILGCICTAALGLASALFSVQILRGDEYVAKANKQYIRPTSMVFDRGSIFYTAKDDTHPTAAALSSGYTVYMDPRQVTDPYGTYLALSQYMDLDHDAFFEKAARTNDPYEELAHKVDTATGQSIAALSLPGIGITKETWRTYISGSSAAHALGLIGENPKTGTIEGRYGLERSYEDVLARADTESSSNVFAHIFSSIHDSVFSASSEEGDVITSIEPTVQGRLEKLLEDARAQWHADELGGIIMDPHTGNIVALAALPDFDPNNLALVDDPSVFSNPLVENAYELGSIMKPLTVAVALDSGAVGQNFTYNDTGTMTLSGKKIANYDGRARGITPLQEILSQSLNVGAATLALKIGKDDFSTYFKSLGFGQKTGIDQPNETPGLTSNLETGRDIEIATMSYGQGIAVSPIAMTRALAALANEGKIVRPHIAEKITFADGTEQPAQESQETQVFKKESVEQVTAMLVKVVDTALRNGALKMDHYTIAAKTGTAQIPNPETKTYYPDRYLHSFFGYFPAYDPKFIVFLYHIYPKGAQYASETLADPFGELAKFLIDYYNIPPDR